MKPPIILGKIRLFSAIQAVLLLAIAWSAHADQPSPSVSAKSSIDAGRYLVTVGGCNDCHTANWAETGGSLPEENWLTGLPVGWRGPWGTSYASNLRLLAAQLSEDVWVAMMQTRMGRPPMPWMNVNRMSETDSRAISRFIRSLGAAGDAMPAAIDGQAEPATPYILLEPVVPGQGRAPAASAARH